MTTPEITVIPGETPMTEELWAIAPTGTIADRGTGLRYIRTEDGWRFGHSTRDTEDILATGSRITGTGNFREGLTIKHWPMGWRCTLHDVERAPIGSQVDGDYCVHTKIDVNRWQCRDRDGEVRQEYADRDQLSFRWLRWGPGEALEPQVAPLVEGDRIRTAEQLNALPDWAVIGDSICPTSSATKVMGRWLASDGAQPVEPRRLTDSRWNVLYVPPTEWTAQAVNDWRAFVKHRVLDAARYASGSSDLARRALRQAWLDEVCVASMTEEEMQAHRNRIWDVGMRFKSQEGWCGTGEASMRCAGVIKLVEIDYRPGLVTNTIAETQALPNGTMFEWIYRNQPIIWTTGETYGRPQTIVFGGGGGCWDYGTVIALAPGYQPGSITVVSSAGAH
jgi:hypothetical protein